MFKDKLNVKSYFKDIIKTRVKNDNLLDELDRVFSHRITGTEKENDEFPILTEQYIDTNECNNLNDILKNISEW